MAFSTATGRPRWIGTGWLRWLPVALTVALASPARAEALDDGELEELVSRPSIALYKAYAEFKMAKYAEAREIWQALADRNVAEAWFNLGILAEDGLGEPRDGRRALEFYEKGALAGSTKAQYRLALLYLDGRLVAPDRDLAERWLEAAAAGGDQDATRQLAQLRTGADTDDYLAARLLESEGRVVDAAQAYRRLSVHGDVRARTRLAWLYEAGRGVPRDLARAAELFAAAAELGDPEAQFALSVMLRTGAGQARDDAAARRWLQKAAEAGYPEAIAAVRAASAED